MPSMRGVGVFCAVVVCLSATSAAHASYDDWKDGCPAFFPTDDQPDYISGTPVDTGSGSVGVLPELDSPLGSTRAATEGWLTQLARESMPDGKPDRVGAGQGLLQFDLTSGPMFVLKVTGGAAFGGDGSYASMGDIQAFVGYRFSSYLFSPLARLVGAVRLGGGGALFGGNEQSLIDQRERLAALSAFRTPQFGFDRPLTFTFEERVELIGCHAPFVDFRIDGSTWQTQVVGASTRAYDLPIEIAGGAYFLPRWATYLAVGVDLRTPESTLLYSYLVRTRAGIELQLLDHTLRIGAHAGGITGGNATGFDLGLTLSWNLPLNKTVFE
jgi:hypothetical protein